MNRHTNTTSPVDAPGTTAQRHPRHRTYGTLGHYDLVDLPAPTWNDPWSGDPDTDRYWAHNAD